MILTEQMKPILFSTPEVQMTLAGHKTQMRQMMKPQPPFGFEMWEKNGRWHIYSEYPLADPKSKRPWGYEIEPKYKPGDVLYVREKWAVNYGGYNYFADLPQKMAEYYQWHPSVHMPRKAARIFLQVADVRAERLQDITEAGAISEGLRIGIGGEPYLSCRDAYHAHWDNLNKKRDYGWDTNPWVWVYTFAREEAR